MTLSIRRSLAIVMAFALFLGILHIPPAAAASSALRDGEFDVPFRYLKDGSTTTSAADAFMEKNSGKLIITNGKAVFEHQITKEYYSTFEYFGSRKPGAAKAVISSSNNVDTVSGLDGYTQAVSRDAASPNTDNIVIRLEIEDVYSKQDILMHINDKENIFGLETNYNNWYNAQLELQLDGVNLTPQPGDGGDDNGNDVITKETFDALLASANDLYLNSVEGQADGQYSASSRNALKEKIDIVEALSKDEAYLEAAYKALDTAIKQFKSTVVVVNRAALSRWILEAKAWLAKDPKDSGFAESGKASSLTFGAAYSEGEYPSEFPSYEETEHGVPLGLTAKVRRELAAAETLFQDPAATQAQVNTMVYEQLAKYNWADIENQRYSKKSTVGIYVLDSIAAGTNEKSQYASEIADTAVLLQQEGTYGTLANITIYDDPNDSIDYTGKSIAQSSPRTSDGLFGPANSANAGKPVILSSTETEKVFQSYVRSNYKDNPDLIQTDMLWQGFVRIRYPMTYANDKVTTIPDVTKTVFISFNADQHKALLDLIDEAQALHDEAVEGNDIGQYPESLKAALQAAIDSATTNGGYLAAPRPAILTATADLQAAIDNFKAGVTRTVYFSAAPATDEAFSAVGSYFNNPAKVTYVDTDTVKVTLTINNSTSLPEFKIKSGESYADTNVISSNPVANTRIVSFEVNGLTSLVDAQVKIADETQAIRLNFNNVDNAALLTLIGEAQAAYDQAVVGTAVGQYPASAKTALQAALAAAGKEAVRIPAASTDTAAAVQTLQQAYNTFKASSITSPTDPSTPPAGQEPQYPENGKYYMNFRILKDGTDENSIMSTYVNTTALVNVSGGTKSVSFTLKQSKQITAVKLNGSSGSVSSNNTANNTRVVTFQLSNLSSKISGWVDVNWPEINYVHNYDVQFLFNESSAVYAGESPSVPGSGENGNVGNPPGLELPGSEEETAAEETEENGTEEPAVTVQFSDISKHWAKSSIESAVKLGIVNGFSDGSFRPDNKVTRGEFAVMISRALMLEGEDTETVFKDGNTIPSWAKDHIARAVAAGLIQGFADDTFRISEQLSRAQLAVIIARAANLKLSDSSTTTFSDSADIPAWASKEVSAAVEAGLVLGKDNRFAPNETSTRAEAITMIMRLLEFFEAKTQAA